MKKNKFFTCVSFVFGLVIFLVSSCKKSNSGASNTASVSAVVSGSPWQSDSIRSYENFGTLGANNGYILIEAYYGKAPGDTSNLELVIADTAHAGLVDHFHCASFEYYTSNYTSYGPVKQAHGTVTVTAWNKDAHTIAGTFEGVIYNTQFNVSDSIKIDNGRFNTSYRIN
jgi:hypothetical protein